MKELLYLEVPTPDIGAVRRWLQAEFMPPWGECTATPDGIRLITPVAASAGDALPPALSIFTWTVQRTTYLKVAALCPRKLGGVAALCPRKLRPWSS
jgi:lycopene cyclase CruA